MNLEYKSLAFQLKSAEETDTGWIVEGYGSTYDVDSGGDQIHHGAFRKTIDERFFKQREKNGKSKIKVLWQHDTTKIIGKFLDLREDESGLYCKIELFNDPDFLEARQAYKLAKWGELDSFSIGYRIAPGGAYREDEDGKDIRHITEVKLYEVSFVTFPMNEKAEMTQVKEESERMFEQILKAIEELSAKLDQAKAAETVVEPEPVVAEEKAKEMNCPDCGEPMTCKACSKKPKEEELPTPPAPLSAEEIKEIVAACVKEQLELLKSQMEESKTEETPAPAEEPVVEEKTENSLEDFLNNLLNTDFNKIISEGNN